MKKILIPLFLILFLGISGIYFYFEINRPRIVGSACRYWYGNNVVVPNQLGNTPWGIVDSCVIDKDDTGVRCAASTNKGAITCTSCNKGFCECANFDCQQLLPQEQSNFKLYLRALKEL